jgi:lipopolysaccharide assembly outer membrane protein LptD (OstA)
MRKSLFVLFAALLSVLPVRGQFGSFSDVPVEIQSDGETRFEGGVAVAEDNVQIHFRGTDIYCDYAEYNPETREVLLVGNIRIYSDGKILNGQRAVFNLETKQIQALDFEGGDQVFKFASVGLRAPTLKQFFGQSLKLTTSDSSEPDYHVRAKGARIYPDDRAILTNATLYVGQTPVFWVPYLYAPLGKTGWDIKPGYNSTWGAFALLGYRFPLTKKIDGVARFDYRTERGVAIGVNLDGTYGPKDTSSGSFRAYYANDTDPETNDTAFPRTDPPNNDRWIVSFKNRLTITEDVYITSDINSISDQYFLQDFVPAEYSFDPQPDNNTSLTWLTESFQVNLLARWQMNDWQEVTSRLPEATWTVKQTSLFGLPVFYDGSTRAGYLQRNYPSGEQPDYITQLQDGVYNDGLVPRDVTTEDLQNFSAFRFDTFHQLSYPKTYFGWLSLTPRVGFRGTYYSRSGNTEEVSLTGDYEDATFRPIVNAGIEGSFKLSARFEKAQSTFLGLDGLMHVFQPFANYAWVENMGDPADEILQFDRVVPSSIIPSLNFPQFSMIDSIDTSSILRLGVRNRLITRRDDGNHEWFALETFFDVNFDNPYEDDPGQFSNLYNNVVFSPVPWVSVGAFTQLPISEGGFTDVNSYLRWEPMADLSLYFSQRYISSSPYFQDDSQATIGGYWRVNENWAVSASGRYDVTYETWDLQRYMVHRDLSSWLISAGFMVTDNRADYSGTDSGEVGVGFLLMLTLKEAPDITLPLAFDVLGDNQQSSQQNGF